MATNVVDAPTAVQTLALARILVPEDNVRALNPEHVTNLATSIKTIGVRVPVIVAPIDADDQGRDHVLVAGFTRYAACAKLGIKEIPYSYTTLDAIERDRAVENIVRRQLNPQEEAVAVKQMLDSNLTLAGVAKALGWSQKLVTERKKLLDLPETAQRLAGEGVIPLSAINTLLAIGKTSGAVLDAVLAHIDAHREDARALQENLRQLVLEACGNAGVFVSGTRRVSGEKVAMLNLSDSLKAEYERATTACRAIGYGSNPSIPLPDSFTDRARAAGCLFEFEDNDDDDRWYADNSPLVTDEAFYLDALAEAVTALADDYQKRAAEYEKDGISPHGVVRPQRDKQLDYQREVRRIAESAHNANTDLGWGLRKNLSIVKADDMDVARFFVYALLGPDATSTSVFTGGANVADLAMRGVRLVVEDFRTDETKTKKDGTKGALRITYGSANDATASVKWLWGFLDAAKTAGELYGRALVVIAAEHYASRLVVPASQRHHPQLWPSHKGIALKALQKLAGPYVPVSLKDIEKAVKKAAAERDRKPKPTPVAADAAATDQSTANATPVEDAPEGINPEDLCAECGAPLADGQGYDGLCGPCADQAEDQENED